MTSGSPAYPFLPGDSVWVKSGKKPFILYGQELTWFCFSLWLLQVLYLVYLVYITQAFTKAHITDFSANWATHYNQPDSLKIQWRSPEHNITSKTLLGDDSVILVTPEADQSTCKTEAWLRMLHPGGIPPLKAKYKLKYTFSKLHTLYDLSLEKSHYFPFIVLPSWQLT